MTTTDPGVPTLSPATEPLLAVPPQVVMPAPETPPALAASSTSIPPPPARTVRTFEAAPLPNPAHNFLNGAVVFETDERVVAVTDDNLAVVARARHELNQLLGDFTDTNLNETRVAGATAALNSLGVAL